MQDALERAASHWPFEGIPDNPAGWLMTVARNRAIDLLRRRAAHERAADALRDLPSADDSTPEPDMISIDLDQAPDERLRLLLLCCHPALGQDAQVALTLRLVAGVSTEEIANAYLVPTPTIAAYHPGQEEDPGRRHPDVDARRTRAPARGRPCA